MFSLSECGVTKHSSEVEVSRRRFVTVSAASGVLSRESSGSSAEGHRNIDRDLTRAQQT